MSKFILIPANIDPDWTRYSVSIPEGIHPNRIMCFIHLIYHAYLFDYGAKAGLKSVYIHSNKLRQLHSQYKVVIEWLKAVEIIDVDNQYFVDEYPRSYRITDQYLRCDVKLYEITDKATIKKALSILNRENSATISKYKALYAEFKSGKLEFDQKGLEKALGKALGADLAVLQDEEEAYLRNAKRKYAAELLNNGQYWFFQDDKGFRLHTNITNMSKVVRHQLKFNGEDLGEIDIKNSQPYFSMRLIEESYHNNLTTIIMFRECEETLDNIGVQRYKDLILGGTIYDYFVAQGEQKHGEYFISNYVQNMLSIRRSMQSGSTILPIIQYGQRPVYFRQKFSNENSSQWIAPNLRGKSKREVAKNMFFQVLYGKHDASKNIVKQLFKELFPDVWFCLGKLKEGGHSNLAIQLQKEESNAVLNLICRRLKRERKSLPLFTIHDCIVTTVGNLEYVKSVIEEELLRLTGYAPKLTTKIWAEEDS